MDLECPFTFGKRYVCSGAPGKFGIAEGVSPLPSVDIFIHLKDVQLTFSSHLKSRSLVRRTVYFIALNSSKENVSKS